MSTRNRVEVATIKQGAHNAEFVATHVVHALRLARRVVEVEWDGTRQMLVFYARVPLPRKVKEVVAKKSTRGTP
jgi:hypothetical protein